MAASALPEAVRPDRERYDVVVVGGGPSGTTFAQLMTRAGHSVLVLERGSHPRFSVGESLLPATLPVWRELGLVERFEKAGFVRKYGAYFCFEDGARPEYFHFPDASRPVAEHAWEVPRAEFDRLLWEAAAEAGAECLDQTAALDVSFDGARATGVKLGFADGERGEVRARLVADCSGRSTLLGHRLGLRQRESQGPKVALYCHYADVLRSTGRDEGTIAIVATPFGWMWLIPFAAGAASVGAVIQRPWYAERRRGGRDHDEIWRELLEQVPAVANRLRGAMQTRPVEATGDFQYRLRELAGDGWVAIGDAGAFLDPVFSSGVHLAVTGAARAARAATQALRGGRLPRARDFARYSHRSRAALRVYAKVIHAWYDPAFREVFMRPPRGRPGVAWLTREVVSVLAGNVEPTWRVLPVVEILRALARMKGRAAEPGVRR
jgi:flavin-dependent dehydrogenase